MKPWEETWVVKVIGAPAMPTQQLFVQQPNGSVTPFDGAERMRLAAQAPAMARLLLSYLEQGDPSDKDKAAEAILRTAGVLSTWPSFEGIDRTPTTLKELTGQGRIDLPKTGPDKPQK